MLSNKIVSYAFICRVFPLKRTAVTVMRQLTPLYISFLALLKGGGGFCLDVDSNGDAIVHHQRKTIHLIGRS
ncbi:hypothetical protein QF003_003303 [Leclercia adecarboxylata]